MCTSGVGTSESGSGPALESEMADPPPDPPKVVRDFVPKDA